MSWLLSPSSATKMTAVLSRNAYMWWGLFLVPDEECRGTDLSAGTRDWTGVLLAESLVRHRRWPAVPDPGVSVSTRRLGTTPFRANGSGPTGEHGNRDPCASRRLDG